MINENHGNKKYWFSEEDLLRLVKIIESQKS